MVNTVGSYETKYWAKKWIIKKQDLVLTTRQKSLIVGCLLGDGTMRIGKDAKNANLKIEQGLAQREYVMWKYLILKPLVFTEPKISYRYRQNQRYPKSWWFRTIRHPLFTQIYKQFYTGEGYRTGRKIIPKNIIDYLDPTALAVWIMDDGSYSAGVINISTYAYSLPEVIFLEKGLKEKFDLAPKHYKDRNKGYRTYFSKYNTQKLVQIIHPYIIPSMMYKIGFVTP